MTPSHISPEHHIPIFGGILGFFTGALKSVLLLTHSATLLTRQNIFESIVMTAICTLVGIGIHTTVNKIKELYNSKYGKTK